MVYTYLWDWRWITTALAFVVAYFVGLFYQKVSKYPRGPFPLPLVGNLLTLSKVKYLHCEATEWSKTYGDVFTLWMSHKPMVFLNGHETIREALLDRRLDFAGRFATKMGTLQNQGDHDILFEDYTPCWKALRKVFHMAVRKYAISEALERLCREVVDNYVDSLMNGPQVINSREPFYRILYTLIGTSVYGTNTDDDGKDIQRLEEIDDEFHKLFRNGLPSDVTPLLAVLYRRREKKLESLCRELTEIFRRLFTRAKGTYVPGSTDNFTHAMLTAREEAIMEEKGDAQYLTEGNMVQLVRNIFGGATDTSAGELHWLFLRMVKEPKIQEMIQKEIDDNIGKHIIPLKSFLSKALMGKPPGSAPPTYKDRARCPFTVACLLETLRCHPALPLCFPHKTTKDTRVGGVFIPKDTGILYNAYGGNRDPKIWDDPEEFRPERFFDPVTGHLREDAQSLLTFGMGSRICPGEKLAHVDMFYILVRLMQRLSCSAPAGQSAVSLESVASSLIMQPMKQNIVLSRKN